jgi:hypothetical protein
MKYKKHTNLLSNRIVWVIEIQNEWKTNTLLLSKVSEAVSPTSPNNHIGEGSTISEFIKSQPSVKFIINGSFNHYRKHFYEWGHYDYNIGDPVGLVKIRNHRYSDTIHNQNYGLLIQEEKGNEWKIIKPEESSGSEKYILGCNPMMVYQGEKCVLPDMKKVDGKVCPPSILWHGLENHARTAIGIKEDKLVFVVVESIGCSLPELQEIGLKLNLDYFLNLDGGGSSQFRIKTENGWIGNKVEEKDQNRILGNVIALF